MARRGNRAEQYQAIAAFYGAELIEDLQNPNIPEFVLVHAARRAAHFGLAALSLEEKQPRRAAPVLPAASWDMQPAQGC